MLGCGGSVTCLCDVVVVVLPPSAIECYDRLMKGDCSSTAVSAILFASHVPSRRPGEIAEDEAERLGLVPSNAYAILDVKEINGIKLLQVA